MTPLKHALRAALLLLALAASAHAQTLTFGQGGASATDGNLTLTSTYGQPLASPFMSGDRARIALGFSRVAARTARPPVEDPAAQPPTVVVPITDQNLTVGAVFTADLGAVFDDPDNPDDELFYAITTSDETVASSVVDPLNATLTVTPLAAGSATITITATDPAGLSVTASFTVTVTDDSVEPPEPEPTNSAPAVAVPIADQNLTVGTDFTADLNPVFTDPDGDALTYSASSSAEAVAAAAVSESVLTVTPVTEGIATITVKADDGNGGTAETTFQVSVTELGEPPSIIDTVPTDGLVAYWQADGNAVDSSGEGNHGTPQNGATFAPGIFGQAFSLDGEDDFILVPDSPSLHIDGDLSIVAWIKYEDQTQQYHSIVSKRDASGTNYQLYLEYGDLKFFNRNLFRDNETLSPDEWHHVGATISSGVLQFYVDGRPSGSSAFTIASYAGDLRIGGIIGYETTYFDGLIDELAIYARALTPAEMQRLPQLVPESGSNAPPQVAQTIENQSLKVGTPFIRDLSTAFSDPDGDAFTYTATSSDEAVATAVIDPVNSTLTVTPVAQGSATLTVTVTDPTGLSAQTSFAVTVAPVEQPPAPGAVGRIAFFSRRDGNAALFAMNADGSNIARLSPPDALNEFQPDWSPDGSRLAFMSGYDIYVMNADGSNRVNLTSSLDESEGWNHIERWPAWSPDGTRIAFGTRRDGGHGLFVMNADGSNIARLADTYSIPSRPSWRQGLLAFAGGYGSSFLLDPVDGSDKGPFNGPTPSSLDLSPDGSKVAFVSPRGNYSQSFLLIMNIDGTELVDALVFAPDMPTGKNSAPVWSPNGKKIAFVNDEDGDPEIYVMHLDGTHVLRLTDNEIEDGSPVWHPVAPANRAPRVIAALQAPTLIAGGIPFIHPPHRIFLDADGDTLTYEVSSSDERVATVRFTPGRVHTADSRIRVSPVGQGSATITITATDEQAESATATFAVEVQSVSAAPVAIDKIAYESKDEGGRFQIYLIDAGGSEPVDLTGTPSFSNRAPAWSPDGTRIAFTSNREDGWEIYVMYADGSGVTRLTYDPEGADLPAWSPDGTRIAFSTTRDGVKKGLFAMNADGSNIARPLSDQPVITTRPTWRPDRLLIQNRYGARLIDVAADTALFYYGSNSDDSPGISLSPDGTRIAYGTGFNQLNLVGIDGSDPVAYTLEELVFEHGRIASLDWSPDGRQLVFVGRDLWDGTTTATYTIDADGTGQARLIADNQAGRPVWSPVTDNKPPAVAAAIGSLSLQIGEDFTRGLSDLFTDPDGDPLTYSATSSNTSVASARIDDDTLVVAPQASGQAVITVTAADPIGATATATFTADVLAPLPDAKISLDLDPADGDQQTLTLTGAPEQAFSVQLFVADVEELMGFTAVFLFDPDALSYDNFTQGPFIPGLVPLAISNADSVEVGGVVLGTGRGTGDGLLGTVNFRTTADFAAQSSVRLALLRLRYTGGREQTLSPGQELQISAETSLVGDFSGDGRVDFSDFFIFADQFGKDVEVGSTFDLNPDGRVDFSDFFVFADQFGKSRGKLIALARELLGLPSAPVLEGNYPNPFNSSTLIPFQLAARSRVRLEIFNLLGQRVRTLVDKVEQPGVHRVAWDGHDDAGRQLTSGLYVYRLLTNGFAAQRRMLLLR